MKPRLDATISAGALFIAAGPDKTGLPHCVVTASDQWFHSGLTGVSCTLAHALIGLTAVLSPGPSDVPLHDGLFSERL
jgi:hypothetical protein